MELEKKVCNLELARKLKALGVKQESLFYWWEKCKGSGSPSTPYEQTGSYCLLHSIEREIPSTHPFGNKFSAFTCAELGELLPMFIYSMRRDGDFICRSYGAYGPLANVPFQTAPTEADARAMMLEYIENHKL